MFLLLLDREVFSYEFLANWKIRMAVELHIFIHLHMYE